MREHLLQRLGSVQHALLTWDQLHAAGLTPREVEGMTNRGRIIRVHRGVYRLAGAPITWEQQMLAACLATRGASSHRSSALSWGVELGPTPPFEVTVDRARNPRRRGVIVHRSGDLTSDQVVRRRGIPTTNPLRMLADLGAVCEPAEVELALDSLTSRRIITVAGARAVRSRLSLPGRAGVGVLGGVLNGRALGEHRADGLLEPAMADLCRRAGLPRPAFQVWVLLDSGWRRLDFAYVELMIDIEVDGYEEHGGKYERWVDDSARDNELTLAGWLVLRFPRTLVRADPGKVTREIREALHQRHCTAA